MVAHIRISALNNEEEPSSTQTVVAQVAKDDRTVVAFGSYSSS